jgi:hypothetical protein
MQGNHHSSLFKSVFLGSKAVFQFFKVFSGSIQTNSPFGESGEGYGTKESYFIEKSQNYLFPTQGADLLPLPLSTVKAGRNHLNE